MPHPPVMSDAVTMFVCTTCRRAEDPEGAPRAGGVLAGVLAEALRPAVVAVQPVECLANCKRGPSAAMTRHGGWSYVFGGLDPLADAPALLEGAALLAASPDGLMPWRGRPEVLKRNMIARIPPFDFTPVEAAP